MTAYRHRNTGTVYAVVWEGLNQWGLWHETILRSPGGRIRHLGDGELAEQFELEES